MLFLPFRPTRALLATASLASLLLCATAAVSQEAESAGSSVIDRRAPAPAEVTGQDGVPPVAPEASSPRDCAAIYHASLARIKAGEFSRIGTARKAAVEGDPRLPGLFFFPPRPATRSKAEMAALASANSLARGKARTVGGSDPDRRWIADRLRVDLSDYLGQKPSPFLCGGVPHYVETLSRFADRIGASPERRADFTKVQRGAATVSVEAALAAMKPAPLPRFAPADRPLPQPEVANTGGIGGLRPAAGLSRADAVAAPTTLAAAADDMDLPPLKPKPPVPLSDVAELRAAIETLLAAAKAGGFLTEPVNQMAIGGHAGLPPAAYPVLSRLAEARQYVIGERPLVEDRFVRSKLSAALSDIEALDYLMRAEAEPADATASAIHATLDAILAAQRRDCTCGR